MSAQYCATGRFPFLLSGLQSLRRMGVLAAAFGFMALDCRADAPHDRARSSAVPPAQLSAPNAAKGLQWNALSPAQQTALKPLSAEWDQLDAAGKTKWLTLAKRFSAMTPDEQQRVQDRMREWAKLTPQERRVARENYTRTRGLDIERKSERWQQYQQLPDDRKRELAAQVSTKKSVTRIPSVAQPKTSAIPPIKSTPQPMLEQSVTPQATSQSPLLPSASQ